jgi:hydrogenase-4 component F
MQTLALLTPVLVPAAGAVGYGLAPRRATAWLGAGCAAAVLTTGVALAVQVRGGDRRTAAGGALAVDALGAYLLVVIGAVALLVCAANPAHLRTETDRAARRYGVLVMAFLAAMTLAVLAADLGVLWIAVETTTVVTAFLVGQHRTRASVEAAWKYVVICSTGIALALLGTVLLHHAATAAGVHSLDLAVLAAEGARLDPDVTRIAVALLIIGFATKAGLVPLHAWLPDAHGQAPAPVSALMSGVLLAVAFYAVLRVRTISDVALGTGFARALLAVLAVTTLLVAASVLLVVSDLKRMLAYSSMEHMGLLALGAAAGGVPAVTAVLLHVLGHGLAKSGLFLCAGHLARTAGTGALGELRGLAARQPVLAGTVGLGVLALVGFPPLSLFASGTAILRAGFANGLAWPTVAALLPVLVISATLLIRTGRLLLGDPAPAVAPSATVSATPVVVPALVGLALCVAVGTVAGPLAPLLAAAAEIVEGP